MNVDCSLFTEKVRSAVRKAVQLARQCQYAQIEPQMLMVALVQEGRDMIAFMLGRLNVDRIAFCGAIGESIQALPHDSSRVAVESSAFEQVLAKSVELSHATGGRVVAMEHIFWAMSEVPGAVKDIMGRFGLTTANVRDLVLEFRNGNQARPAESEAVEENVSTLTHYAKNLLKLAEEGAIEPAIGRDEEIRRVLQILSRKTKNNPVLVGEPGTGKTAIVEGLAHRILRGDVPQDMRDLRPYELDLAAMVAGASAPGKFEERLKRVIAEVVRTPNIVLFIDEIHMLIGAGRTSGAMDAANILKPELARGKLKVIGATTPDEYRKHIETDKAFERRFQKVTVDEPDVDSAVTILRGIKNRFENHHRIKILDEAAVAAVRLSARYVSDRFLPDKAIDLLDEAASRMRIERSSVPRELDVLTRQIRYREVELASIRRDGVSSRECERLELELGNLREKKNVLNAKWQNERSQFERLQVLRDQIEKQKANREIAEQGQRFSEVAEINHRIKGLEDTVSALTTEMEEIGPDRILKAALDAEDIMDVVTSWTGIPVSRLKADEAQDLLRLEKRLGEKVVGQARAIEAVSKVIRRNRAGLNDEGRPIGSFLFLGSTGVGKTELVKALSECLFNSREAMVRIDMSEYQQEYSVSRLFGAPPGYVGYDQGGQLTEAVRRKPYSVVLFDEIEKAHPKVFETLLQVLDDGRMTDGQGRTVSFKNTIIVMTSNMGQDVIRENLLTGIVTDEIVRATTDAVMAEMKHRVAPEFVNRIDEVVMFLPLTREEISRIVRLQLNSFRKRMLKKDVDIAFDDELVGLLTERSYIPEFGARPVKRAIDDRVVNTLGQRLLSGEIDRAKPIWVSCQNGEVEFSNVEMA